MDWDKEVEEYLKRFPFCKGKGQEGGGEISFLTRLNSGYPSPSS